MPVKQLACENPPFTYCLHVSPRYCSAHAGLSTQMSHVVPLYDGMHTQLQRSESALSTHVPPCLHGVLTQGCMSKTVQCVPAYCGVHVHANASMWTLLSLVESAHVAPFRHGCDAHSSTSTHVGSWVDWASATLPDAFPLVAGHLCSVVVPL